jgi:hypothetical protein
MVDEMEVMEEFEELAEMPEHSIMDIFDELTFKEKWDKVFAGLKMPPETGDYKFARLQLIRLAAPISAVLVPILAVLLLIVFAALTPPPPPKVQIAIMEPEEIEELDEIEEIIEEPPDPPDPIEMDFTPDVDFNNPDPTPPTDFSPQPAEFDSVAMVKSPVIFKGMVGSRSPGSRGQARKSYGGGNAAEGAVMRALRWFKLHQEANGSWTGTPSKFAGGGGKSAPVAMTGMVLLAYLAHGETPASEEFGYTVEAAIRFLAEEWNTKKWPRRYEHQIATYAMCEAFALTKVPMIGDVASDALYVLIEGQNPEGSWRYSLKPTDQTELSTGGWCAQALKAGKMAGLNVGGLDAAMKKAIGGIKKCYGGVGSYGGFGYTSGGEHGLTGAGVLCLQLLGDGQSAEAQNGLGLLREKATYEWGGKGKFNHNYYWYYITQAKFHGGGNDWVEWNKKFAPVLVQNQNVTPKAIEGPGGKMFDIGCWQVPNEGHTAGVTMDTALCCLQLEVYYRYLPTFKKGAAEEHAPEAADIGVKQENADDDLQIEIDI